MLMIHDVRNRAARCLVLVVGGLQTKDEPEKPFIIPPPPNDDDSHQLTQQTGSVVLLALCRQKRRFRAVVQTIKCLRDAQ